jgi:hypothetical protein
MKTTRRIRWMLVMLAIGMGALETGTSLFSTGTFGPGLPAEARVGRPLTPVSAAGVARRTVRRCAAGVYYC